MKTRNLLVAVGAAVGLSGSALAATVVQLDVNSLTATATGGTFNQNFTGTITLAKDANSSLANVLKDGQGVGIGFTGPYSGANLSFTAIFNFMNGNITGMGIEIGVDKDGDTVFEDVYTATVNSGMGNILPDAGDPGSWIIAASTRDGMFSNPTFAGVDVSEFFGPLVASPGNFINFKIDGAAINGMSRSDNDVDIDIFVNTRIIPLPTPVAMASIGLVGLASIRRRRAS